jgi:hypothetical protein
VSLVSINVWRLAGDTLDITCNTLCCNHQVYRDDMIILYIYIYKYMCIYTHTHIYSVIYIYNFAIIKSDRTALNVWVLIILLCVILQCCCQLLRLNSDADESMNQ